MNLSKLQDVVEDREAGMLQSMGLQRVRNDLVPEHWQQPPQNRGYYAKWNKSDRERRGVYDSTYTWNLKNKTNNKQKRNMLIDTENKLYIYT